MKQLPDLIGGRLKSHESPRAMGRNKKGKLATARLRQIKKQRAILIANLKHG